MPAQGALYCASTPTSLAICTQRACSVRMKSCNFTDLIG